MDTLGINWNQLGTFNLDKEHVECSKYMHPGNKVKLPIITSQSITIKIKNFALSFFKIFAIPLLIIDRMTKLVMTYLICPFQFFSSDEAFYKKNAARISKESNGEVEIKSFVLSPEGKKGPKLDAIEVIPKHQKDLPPEEQKWIVFALPNAVTHQTRNAYRFLVAISRLTGLCVTTTNYRGARKLPIESPKSFRDVLSTAKSIICNKSPKKFNDLVDDVDSLLEYQTNKGISPKNILVHGFSLGGIVALNAAARHQKKGQEMNYCGENTVNRLHEAASGYASGRAMVKFAQKGIENYLRPPVEGIRNMKGRAYYAFKEIISATPHLILRITHFSLMFFENLYFANIVGALKSLKEIGKTFFYEPLALASALLTLTLSPIADLTPLIRFFNTGMYESFGDHVVFRMIRSNFFSSLMEKYITHKGWATEGAKVWNKIKGHRFSSAVKQDTVIHWESSLVNGIYKEHGSSSEEVKNNTYIHECKNSIHNTPLIEEKPALFFDVLERSLDIKFPKSLYDTPDEQIRTLFNRVLFG